MASTDDGADCDSNSIDWRKSLLAITWSDVIQFCQFLAETYPRKLETNIFTQHITSQFCVCTVLCKNEQRFLRHTIQHKIKPDTALRRSENSPDLISVEYKVWGIMQERVYCWPILDIADLKRHLTVAWSNCSSVSSTRHLTSGVDGCVPM